MAFCRFPLFLVKKLTVSGSNGYIQGNITAVNPPNSPNINICQSVLGFSAGRGFLLLRLFACCRCLSFRYRIGCLFPDGYTISSSRYISKLDHLRLTQYQLFFLYSQWPM
jgi:hypothetical protein